MKDQFADYETSKMLKELGFDKPCFAYYDSRRILEIRDYPDRESRGNWKIELPPCTAPLWQQVKEWLWIHKAICMHTFSDVRDEGTLFICEAVHGYAPIIKQIQNTTSPITAEIEGIKKTVEYLHQQKT